MKLKKRNIDILLLINNNPLSLGEMSSIFSISERNLRYEIDTLDFYLKHFLSEKIEKKNKKYSINLSRETLDIFLIKLYKNFYILSSKEREEKILYYFLFEKNFRLSNIEKEMNITRATLKKDIVSLNIFLKNYELEISLKENRYLLTGNEKKYRNFKTLKILEYFSIEENQFLPKENSNKLFFSMVESYIENISKENLVSVIFFVENIQKKFQIIFSKEFKNLIIIFILISLSQIKKEKIITRKTTYNFLIDTPYFSIVKKEIQPLIPSFLNYEIAHLTEYLISGGVTKNIEELSQSIDYFIENLIMFLEEKMTLSLNLNEFKTRLKKYLIPAMYRLRNNFTIGTSVMKDKLYFWVEEFCSEDAILPEKLTDNEVSYIRTLIDDILQKEDKKVLSLKTLMEIIERNSAAVNEKQLSKELLEKYSDFIKIDI